MHRTKKVDNKPSESRQNYAERKENEKLVRKAERKVSGLESKISKMEEEISDLDEKMADPGNIEDQSVFFSYEEKRKLLEKYMAEWEDASNKLESLKGG
jgi:ATP-binding cassette subfamily F protein 3